MFVVVQHPFADMREFVGVATGRLDRPAWPLVEANVDFVRSSGLVRPRRKGGLSEWAGEETYGDASNALRFPDRLGNIKFGPTDLQGSARSAFRRFYSEGRVARVEAGLRINLAESDVEQASAASWLKLVEHCVGVPTRVRGSDGKFKDVALLAAGRDLAAHYLRASTSRKSGVQPEGWWFQPATPAIVIDRWPPSQAFPRVPHSRVVLDDPAIGMLFHASIQFGAQRCSTWWLTGSGKRPDDVRRLRIHILRLHAEFECLRLVLTAIRSGRLSVEGKLNVSDAVQDYLNNNIPLMERNERYGLSQSPIFEAAMQATGLALGGASATYKLMRRQIAVKVDRIVRRAEATAAITYNISGDQMNNTIEMGNVSVTGDFNFVTAKNISASFNKAASADVNDVLKQALKTLTVEVAKLVKELPPDDAETASKNLEVLTSEAVSRKPRKDWYDLSANGLLDAAKTVASLAAPVTTAVKAVIALLA